MAAPACICSCRHGRSPHCCCSLLPSTQQRWYEGGASSNHALPNSIKPGQHLQRRPSPAASSPPARHPQQPQPRLPSPYPTRCWTNSAAESVHPSQCPSLLLPPVHGGLQTAQIQQCIQLSCPPVDITAVIRHVTLLWRRPSGQHGRW